MTTMNHDLAHAIVYGPQSWSKVPAPGKIRLLLALNEPYVQKRLSKILLEVVDRVLVRTPELSYTKVFNGVYTDEFLRNQLRIAKQRVGITQPLFTEQQEEHPLAYNLLHIVSLAAIPSALDDRVLPVLGTLCVLDLGTSQDLEDLVSRVRLGQVKDLLAKFARP